MMGKANPTDASKCLFRPRLLIIQIGKVLASKSSKTQLPWHETIQSKKPNHGDVSAPGNLTPCLRRVWPDSARCWTHSEMGKACNMHWWKPKPSQHSMMHWRFQLTAYADTQRLQEAADEWKPTNVSLNHVRSTFGNVQSIQGALTDHQFSTYHRTKASLRCAHGESTALHCCDGHSDQSRCT